ncbi:distal tail protein Dit [Cytobacillus oceanisediminis]|uniref:distal tail protein Dit n=1 Tax=Cytobacillus oceanisediminis TaxID=665099 RepID=UPI00207A346C|nr:distal tail protein Dit [Cytobacillus oceanisediminis]USK43719.1 phage tail family protein [Cytobacillus oceanisediminis]
MLFSLSFNGIKKDYLICERGKRRSAFAPIKRNLLTFPGMAGAYLESTDTEVRIIQQPITINAKDRLDERKLEEDLSDWLVTGQPAELIFDDEPDRVYYAVVDGSLDIEDIARFGKGTITFVCPDPYKYGEEKPPETFQDVSAVSNLGTVETGPIFNLEVLHPVTFAMVQKGLDQYMMIGNPTEVTSEGVDPRRLLFEETGTTLNSWSTALPEMEGGSQGTIGYDGAGITAPSYGSGSGYHGPSVFKEVPLTQHFEIELRGQLQTSDVKQTGRLGFFLFDDQMREIAYMGAIDNSVWLSKKSVEGRIGPFIGDFKNYLISSRNYQFEWDNFPVYMRLRRIGDTYEFYAARVLGNGKHMEPFMASWTVWEDKFRGPLKYVGIFIDKHGDSLSPHTNRIDYIKVNELVEITFDQTPYIAYPGDVITFNHVDSEILINGEDRTDLKDFGANYFSLDKGVNQLIVLPAQSFNTSVRFRERYR